MKELVSQEWFTHLVDNIDHLYCETKYKMGEDLVYYYHQLGEFIVKENGNFERKKIYGLGILELVRKSLENREKPIKISTSSLYRAKQFYTQNPDWEKFKTSFNPDKKGIVWHDVCKALPLPKEIKEPKDKDEVEQMIKKGIVLIEKLPDKFTSDIVLEILKAWEEKIKWLKKEIGK